MKAMMLTAGLGTRLRPVTERFAKPAVPFLNVPLFYYPISLMEEVGITSLVVNTHHRPEQIEKLAQRIPGAHYPIAFSNEPGTPLGSGGGIWKARALLEGGGDFLVSNGDEVILPRERGVMKRFLADHLASGALATILVMEHPLVGTQFGGVWADAKGDVHGFGKDASAFGPSLKGYHYIGLLLLNDRVFNFLPDGQSNILYDALTAAIATGERVRAVVGAFTWYETGNPHDFLTATSDALQLYTRGEGEDAAALKRICARFWPTGTTLGHHADGALVLKCESSSIDAIAAMRGFVVLGENAHLERGARVQNAVLLPGARVFREHANAILIPSS